MKDIILSVRNVVKQYDGHRAIDDVSFNIHRGEVFGLLGPNGAGKTSLIRVITNITQADSGSVLLNGQDTRLLPRGLIGYMPEERGLYKKMKIYEQLLYFAALRGIKKQEASARIDYWLRRMKIADWAHKNVEELSKGMQQKIQFIATVLHEPEFLLLDEPFSGLDPVNTELLKKEILELNKNGTTLMFSTHQMEQVEEICQRIVLINAGKKVIEDNVDAVKQLHKDHLYQLEFLREIQFASIPASLEIHRQEGNVLWVKAIDRHILNEFIRDEIGRGNDIIKLNEILPSLNDIFIKTVNSLAAAKASA